MGSINKDTDRRILFLQIFIVIWIAAIGVKLVKLQVKDHHSLRARAERQQQAAIDLSPTRGLIYDRNGNELARSVEAKSLYASPAEIKDPEGVADKLANLFEIDRDALYKRLTSTQVVVAVKRKLSAEEVRQVEALGLPGLRFVNEMKRYYLSGQTASHLLGFVDIDEHGQAGLEQALDKQIRGRGGRLLLDVDALKKSYDHSVEESIPGASITLTIDTLIQHYAERALADAIRTHNARGGTIVIMRPATGEILAMASFPTFDPNDVSESTEIARRNRAVETAFEPGSIFKLVTYSAALEERLITSNTKIDCGGGQIRIADRIIHDHPYGVLTATQALAKSSNVAAIKIGIMLGNQRLARYIEQYGFGRRTGIELPAESRGVFRPANEWGPTSIGSIPMGHEIGVTAAQAVAAYACIANGGEYVQPYIVSRITNSAGAALDEHKAETRKVVSATTAATVTRMLEGVVMRGTGKAAQLSGYRAAGKTGTAQKIDERTGRYSQTKYVASFVGFAPVENPEIACIVSIDEPVGAHHGGDVAAPVFARVVTNTLRALGVPPEDDPSSRVASAAHVYQQPDAPKEKTAIARNETTEAASHEANAIRPVLNAATLASTDSASKPEGMVMPNLMGKTIREAVALCAASGLKLKPSGEGVVVLQNPSPGAVVAQDATCIVKLLKQPGKKDKPEVAAKTSGHR